MGKATGLITSRHQSIIDAVKVIDNSLSRFDHESKLLMRKSKISKKLAVCFASTFALLLLFSETGYCQKAAMYTRGNWQTSLEPAK